MSEQARTSGPTSRAVVGLFDSPKPAEAAVRALKAAGFTDREIGVIMRDLGGGRELVEEAVNGGAAEDASTAATGAAAGAATGSVVGGLLGVLGSLLLPGVGPVVAAGVLGSALVGAGAGAATGGLLGGLVGMGLPAEDARHFDRGFREGRVLVSVHAEGERARTAERLMSGLGGDLGPSRPAAVEAWSGVDRRSRSDQAYTGPERRAARV